ncbi:MAG: hypothetical protein U0168_27860 [Nannocystaceae bacterium]
MSKPPAADPAAKPVVSKPLAVSPNALLGSRALAPNPALSRLMLASLRRFVDGVASPSAVDLEIAKVLGRNRNAKRVAKQLLARIDARPATARQLAFGGEPPADTVTRDQLATAVDNAGLMFNGVGVTPAGSLPDEAVAPPASFDLEISGLEPVTLSDGDADGDELLALTAFVAISADGFTTNIASAPGQGSLDGITSTAPIPLDVAVFKGNKAGLLASVVTEVDGNADAVRSDFAVMLALAQAHAQLLAAPGDNDVIRINRFALTLDYTVALLAVADPEKWPTGALQKTIIMNQTSLDSLYATPASTAGAVPWKITHDHQLPKGRYKLYYDVPSPVRERSRLKVVVSKAEALDGEPGGADLTLSIDIDGASAQKNFPDDKNTNTSLFAVQRKLAPDRAVAKVEIVLADRFVPDWGLNPPCGNNGAYPPCSDFGRSNLDIEPAKPWGVWASGSFEDTAELEVDLATGAITGTATGKLGDKLTMQGTDTGNRGRVTVTITLEK